MDRLTRSDAALLGLARSRPDTNRLYSILLDAKASRVSENMCDIAETIVQNERDNAKNALEKLWSLKNSLPQQEDTGTLDLLISYYQDKLDILRNRQEHIKEVSTDTRSLLEEKRRRDSEIASVKQSLEECRKEIEKLQESLEKSKVKEQELLLIDAQLQRELRNNENEIVNGLYEIIMSHEMSGDTGEPVDSGQADTPEVTPSGPPESPAPAEPKVPAAPMESQEPDGMAVQGGPEDLDETASVECTEKGPAIAGETKEAQPKDIHALYTQFKQTDPDPFPKSVVKTTSGVVIAEYYYHPRVYRNQRHYVYNTLFLMEQLAAALSTLQHHFDRSIFNEALQMVQDAGKRVEGQERLHFEVSTNEIVNTRSMRELLAALKGRQWDDVLYFCRRIHAKIKALGANYRLLLREQLERLSADS